MSPGTGIGPAGVAFLALLGIALPYGAWRSGRALRSGEPPPRTALYLSTLAVQLVLGACSLATARFEGIAPQAGAVGPRELLYGASSLALLFATMSPAWRASARRGDRRVALFAPRDAPERTLWVAVSLSAAVAEELAWRGVGIDLLARLGIERDAAVLLAAGSFGLAHLAQGGRAALVVAGWAVGAHLLVGATGGLAVAIGVHFVYDVVAGLACARMLRRAQQADASRGRPTSG